MGYSYAAALNIALMELQNARKFLLDEIAGYPTPISRCDAQFNQLLSDRTRIADAIQALENQPFVATPRILEPGAVLESG